MTIPFHLSSIVHSIKHKNYKILIIKFYYDTITIHDENHDQGFQFDRSRCCWCNCLPWRYGNTMRIKSFVREQRTFYFSLFFYFLAFRDHFFLLLDKTTTPLIKSVSVFFHSHPNITSIVADEAYHQGGTRVLAKASFGVLSRKSILQNQEKYVLLLLYPFLKISHYFNMRVRRQSYLLFCLFHACLCVFCFHF